jgi:ABC-2 type transport system permease protein
MAPSPTPHPTSLFSSALRIFDLSLGQMLWSRRSVFLAILAGGPVVLSFAIRVISSLTLLGPPRVQGARIGGEALFGLMIWVLYVRFIIPVLGVFYGTSLIADEVEDKTITYLFTRPIPRAAVLFGKYAAYLVCTALIVLPSVVVVYFLIVPIRGGSIGAAFPSLVADLGVMAVGLASYGALFGFVGARLKRPLVIGLVFAFGWEPGVLLFPGYLKRLTVAYYLQALVPHSMPDDSSASLILRIVTEVPSLRVSLLSLALVTMAALWLAGRAVNSREYVLDQ